MELLLPRHQCRIEMLKRSFEDERDKLRQGIGAEKEIRGTGLDGTNTTGFSVLFMIGQKQGGKTNRDYKQGSNKHGYYRQGVKQAGKS